MKRLLAWVLVFVLVCLCPITLAGWGREGHAVIAALAEAHLTPGAEQAVHALLQNQSMGSIASWADDVRPQRDETYNWHFVDIPKSAMSFDEVRDCFRPDDTHAGAQTDHHNCVVDRITMFQQVLGDPNAAQNDRVEALKFLVHFVGDVHQPFHAVGDARGANDIKIVEFGSSQCRSRPCNLHSAWDDGLIQHTSLNADDYVTHLEQLITDEHLTASGAPQDWAEESHKFAQAAWLNNGDSVDESYYQAQIKVVDERMALAGLRLAALLNAVFSQQAPPPPIPVNPAPSSGQEAMVTRNTSLRSDPSLNHKAIETLLPGDDVSILDPNPVNGYYHVSTDDGKDGWVIGTRLNRPSVPAHELALAAAAHPAGEISESWDKPNPNKTTFQGPDGNCPWNGNDTDPDTYVRKNRTDVPSVYHDVDWAAIHDLPFPTDKPHRADWSPVHLAQIAKVEGVAVRTTGYLVAIKPQSGHGEGTNCEFTLASETDTHIALVGKSGDGENDSVVIEFTPRFLAAHKNWNNTFLSQWLDTQVPVRISGWLMLDPDHRNHLNKYRHTLWEIHPITKIEVYEGNEWKDIDQMQ
jgi:hypothetical protein